MPSRGPHDALRGPEDGPEGRYFSTTDRGQSGCRKKAPLLVPRNGRRCPPEGPKTPQEGPKTAQEAFKTGQNADIFLQPAGASPVVEKKPSYLSPKTAQEALRRAPRRPKRTPRRPKKPSKRCKISLFVYNRPRPRFEDRASRSDKDRCLRIELR